MSEKIGTGRLVTGGVKCAAIGDSNTIGYDPVTALPTDYRLVEQSWFTVAVQSSRGMLQFLTNQAIGGQTSTQIIGAQLTAALAAQPNVIFGMMGTNDPANSITTTVTADNIHYFVSNCRANNVIPVIFTIPPRATYDDEVRAINGFVRWYARQYKVDMIDVHSICVDPDTTGFLSAVGYGDGVHLNEEGARRVADAVLQWAEKRFTQVIPELAYYQGASGDVGNLIAGGVFEGSISSGVPANWTLFSGAETTGNSVCTLVDPVAADNWPTPMKGKWWQVVKTGSSVNSTIWQTTSSNYSVGDELEFTGRVQVPAELTGGEVYVDTFLSFVGSGGVTLYGVSDYVGAGDLMWQTRRAVPSGTTAVQTYLRVRRVSGSISGTVRFGQIGLHNNTTDNWSSLI